MIIPAVVATLSLQAIPHRIEGHAIAVDSVTIELEGERIRLWGLTAPTGQAACTRDGEGWDCVQTATFHLVQMISDWPVACEPTGEASAVGETFAHCHVRWDLDGGEAGWEWVDLNRQMIRSGWAMEDIAQSGGLYAADERAARSGAHGLWAGEILQAR